MAAEVGRIVADSRGKSVSTKGRPVLRLQLCWFRSSCGGDGGLESCSIKSVSRCGFKIRNISPRCCILPRRTLSSSICFALKSPTFNIERSFGRSSVLIARSSSVCLATFSGNRKCRFSRHINSHPSTISCLAVVNSP